MKFTGYWPLFKSMCALFFKYTTYRLIEREGSDTCFKVINRDFDMSLDIEEKALDNTAFHKIKAKGRQRRITFWLAFREKAHVKGVKVNGRDHPFKHHTAYLPVFDFSVNYIVVNGLNLSSGDEFSVEITYQIQFANFRDDFYTMLENYVTEDEFHLFYSWFPILGSRLLIKDILAGKIPQAQHSAYKLNLKLSKSALVGAEGKVISESQTEYTIVNRDQQDGLATESPLFIAGGELSKIPCHSHNTQVNLYYRKALDEHLVELPEEWASGIDRIICTLKNFGQGEVNIYALPIIAGGYGLTYSVLVNENMLLVPRDGYIYKDVCRTLWHEFIHRWWGNRVSAQGSGKYLLTEGMTVLFDWLMGRDMFGNAYFNQVLHEAKKQVLQVHGCERSLADANRIPPYGNVNIYKKAPLVLYQLMQLVGEDKFKAYCVAFLRVPGVYSWDEFIFGLEAYTNLDLSGYNAMWVYDTALPEEPTGGHIVLVDDRCLAEKELDSSIAEFRKNRDYAKLECRLNSAKPKGHVWNKYCYYLGLCEKAKGNTKGALDLFARMHSEISECYALGLFEQALLNKGCGNRERYRALIQEIVTGPYTLNDPRPVWKEYANYLLGSFGDGHGK